jgi:hypothetical protein
MVMCRGVKGVRWFAGIVACAALGAGAEPVVTGAEVREFLGDRNAKLVYTKLDSAHHDKVGRSLWYLDFSEDELVERKILETYDDTAEPRNEMISPDGEWVAYNLLNTEATSDTNREAPVHAWLYVSKLQENAPEPTALGMGALPHWWKKPGTDELYLMYNGKDLENGGWVGCWPSAPCYPPRNSPTYCLRMDPTDMTTVGSATELTNLQMNGGRSRNGAWMFSAGGLPMSARMDSLAVSDATVHERINLSVDSRDDKDSLDGCNPSMSPHWRSEDIRLLYLDKPHLGYHICDVRGENREHILWENSENPYIDEPEWSTGKNYATAKASPNAMDPPYDIYIIRMIDHASLKVLDGNYSFPHLWIEGTNAVRDRDVLRSRRGALSPLYRQGVLTVRGLDRQGSARVEVLDVRGRVVAAATVRGRNPSIAVSMSRGAYLVRIVDGSMRGTSGEIMVR